MCSAGPAQKDSFGDLLGGFNMAGSAGAPEADAKATKGDILSNGMYASVCAQHIMWRSCLHFFCCDQSPAFLPSRLYLYNCKFKFFVAKCKIVV